MSDPDEKAAAMLRSLVGDHGLVDDDEHEEHDAVIAVDRRSLRGR